MNSDEHWDNNGSLKERFENEIADVLAASQVVVENFDLDWTRVVKRANEKAELFRKWHREAD